MWFEARGGPSTPFTMEELITLREAAKRLGVHISTIRTWVRENRIPSYRMGARFTRVSWSDLLATFRKEPRKNADQEESSSVVAPSTFNRDEDGAEVTM